MRTDPPRGLDAEWRSRLYQAIEAHKEMNALAEDRDAARQALDAARRPHTHAAPPEHRGRVRSLLAYAFDRRRGAIPRTGKTVEFASPIAAPASERDVHLLPVSMPGAQKSPRILVDVTGTAFHDFCAGIPRFVREIAAAAYATGEGLPVFLEDGAFWTIYDGLAHKRRIGFEAGDILLIPDLHYQHLEAYADLVPALKAAGGRLVVFLHDIIPLTHPTTCFHGMPAAFLRWFSFVVADADAVVTPSATAASTVRQAAADFMRRTTLPIGWTPGGASLGAPRKPASAAVARALATKKCFLMVGTLEPRKGHTLALDAFERLWQRDVDVALLIVARPGWGTEHLVARIRGHARYQRSLFRVDDADDDDLAHAYSGCAALVAPSLVEGYGLPLLEAASFGAHRVVSDIPVFREVAGHENVTFVPSCDPAALAAAIEAVPARAAQPKREIVPPTTWAQASARLYKMIRDSTYQDAGHAATSDVEMV